MKFFVANWKMNKTVKESLDFLRDFIPSIKEIKDREIGIAPTFVCLESVGKALENTPIKLCAQNVFYEKKGAYTGEISPTMLKDLNVEYVIIGHSERRKYFQETDEIINRKIKASINEQLKVIFCIGETIEERQSNMTFDVLKRQIEKGLENINNPSSIVLAYEPVWAIGTGIVASEKQIEEAHAFIRDKLKEIYSEKADSVRILYGGSVTPENIYAIMNVDNVDGVLVGGASLDAQKFSKIVKYEKQK
ncbi:MAG: triose-phosphate isomerase [Thermodesulfovibrio sp.]|uniref:triose-phosphate isomerase n=1 Tax=unclassified Thermodesulfovibrio TaxID=2645936 RepID=UPI0020B121EE|nr:MULTISPECIES: triose-phosphate isomerase [unclassified Thermodesulfovibrio]MDI1472391.1 triose-phosphate isomerase [Thermodesulfovibrio sp. 1176]MDI6714256.1 triose-phosphate isomerase [Thermodesulfovibrio sp.]